VAISHFSRNKIALFSLSPLTKGNSLFSLSPLTKGSSRMEVLPQQESEFGLMLMPTFDWNTVVYDSKENVKTAYKRVTAYQGSKGSQIHELTMRDHNGDEVFHPHQSNAAPLTIKYHYPVIEMAVTDSKTPPTNTHDNLPLHTCAPKCQVLVSTHLNDPILTHTLIPAHTTPRAHNHTHAPTHKVLKVRTESANTSMSKST